MIGILQEPRSAPRAKFAEILARATAVPGSRNEADQWLERPAVGLDQRRPIDLLATPAGVEIVQDFPALPAPLGGHALMAWCLDQTSSIVSEDKNLLVVNPLHGVRVLRPAQFLWEF
jgi:hypothetical protein